MILNGKELLVLREKDLIEDQTIALPSEGKMMEYQEKTSELFIGLLSAP